jgi:two-component system, NarL family, nitrate/nitrite response regulator NarL
VGDVHGGVGFGILSANKIGIVWGQRCSHCSTGGADGRSGVIAVACLVLGDDHVVFLDALRTVLTQQGYTVSAVARTADEMVEYAGRQRPDACLIDWPGGSVAIDDDAETIRRLIAASSRTRVLVLGADPRGEAAERALAAGASGYLHQSCGVGALVSALERVLRGEVVVGVPELPHAPRSPQQDQAHRLAAYLTGRERECLMMLVEGLDTTAMVARLGVSRTTIRTHLQAVLTKLGVHSRLEAASFAVRFRLVDAWSEDNQQAAAGPVRPFQPLPNWAARSSRTRLAVAHSLTAVAGRAASGG